MEDLDRDRWRRLLEAVREVDATPVDETPDRIPRPPLAAEPAARARAAGPALWLVVRILGALALLAVGAVHLHEYLGLYSAIPTIGTLFVLNFAASTVIGVGLIAPVERLAGRRWGGSAAGALALAAIGLAATSLVFLTIAEHTPIFGFMEPGYDPAGILASRIAEGATVALLGPFLIARLVARRWMGRW
jgi:hypothetical protein